VCVSDARSSWLAAGDAAKPVKPQSRVEPLVVGERQGAAGGLFAQDGLLVVMDGAKALAAAVNEAFGTKLRCRDASCIMPTSGLCRRRRDTAAVQ
jgi:hypothetical protein